MNHEEQNPSSNSPPKCSAVLTVHTFKDVNSISQRSQNGFDPSLIKSDDEEVRDIVQTIENTAYRIIDDNLDLANHSSNTLGMLVKDSLILKVKQSDTKEVPFDGLKTSLAYGPIIDDDLKISFLPHIESLAPDTDSENLSTKRKKSVSLAEEVKVFDGIENEFFVVNEEGFCNELIDNRNDKIMDREKSATEREDGMNEKIPTPQGQGSESSFLNSLNTEKNVVETGTEIVKDLDKKCKNSTEDPMILSLVQLISNNDEESQEIHMTDHYVHSGVLDARNWTIASAREENQSIMSLVETKSCHSSSKMNQSLVLEDDENTQRNESNKSSHTIDNLDTDEVYGRKKSSDGDEHVNEENEKIKQIRKLMNEFLSSLKNPSGYSRQAEDQTPSDLKSTHSSEDMKQESAIAIATVTIRQSQPVLEINKTLEDKISENGIQSFNHSDEEIQDSDSYVEGDDSQTNQKAREVTKISNSFENVEKNHSESFNINDQLLADIRLSDTLINSEIDGIDVTETSDVSETNEVEGNKSNEFLNNEQLDELKLIVSVKEIDIKSTFVAKMENSTNDPLPEETWGKVSLMADNLSKQSSGTDHRSTNDISLKQTSSTVSQGGSKSSKKSSSDVIRPDPNNITVETFPVFPEDKDVPKDTDSLHIKELELTSITMSGEKSPVTNLEDDEYKDSGGNGLEDSTGAFAVIEVLRTNSNEKDIKSEEKDPVNEEEAVLHKSRSVKSQGSLQRSSETVTRNHSPDLFKTEPAVVAYLATSSAVEYQMENERHKEGSSNAVTPDEEEPLNILSNLKSIFKSLNESKSEKLCVPSIEDIENTDTVNKLSEIEFETVGVQPIKSTKSLQNDRRRIQDKRTTGHKLLDDPVSDIETVVQQSCPAASYNFKNNENKNKSEVFVVANDETNSSEESVIKSILQKLSTHEEKIDGETPKVSEEKIKIKKLTMRKSDENAKKFAKSLSRIFSNSSNRKNGGKESRAALASHSSVKDHFEIPKIPVSSSDDPHIQEQSCEIERQKSDNNREELVGVKSLDSIQDSFTAYKESIVSSSSKYSTDETKDVQEIRKSVEKIYATKCTIVENGVTEDRNDDVQPLEKSQRKSSRKSFAGIRKLFSGSSTRNKKDHQATEDLMIPAKISSFTSVNDNENENERSVDDTKKNSLLSMAKSYIRRQRSEFKTDGRVKHCTESSEDSITLSTEDQKKILKERSQSLFSRSMRRLFKKRNSVVDSVASTNNGARDSVDDDLEQSSDVQKRYSSDDLILGSKSSESRNNHKAKNKSDIEQLVYSAMTGPSWKDFERNEFNDKSLLDGSIEKKSDGWPDSRSKSHNRSTISDDDIETYSNFELPEGHTAEIRFMERDKPEKKTDFAKNQLPSEIASNNDFRPIPSFAGRRSTIVMMATPMAPREEAQPEESSSSNQPRDESSSSPTVFYYLLGPSLDEALIDVRVIFQNLIDKIIGRRR